LKLIEVLQLHKIHNILSNNEVMNIGYCCTCKCWAGIF